MIKEPNFIQMQQLATAKYMKNTEHRYKTEDERVAAENAYIQGRVDAVSDLESIVAKYNILIDEKNKLEKELAALKVGNGKTSNTAEPIEELGL